MNTDSDPTQICDLCLREKKLVKPCLTKLSCGSCKLHYYKQIDFLMKTLLKTLDSKTSLGKKNVREFITLKTTVFIRCKHWKDSMVKSHEIDNCSFCKSRMVIFGFEGRLPKTKSSVLNPAAFKQIVFEFPGVVEKLKVGDVKTMLKEISTETEAKLVSTQISRVSDSRIGIKIIDRINEILFSVQNNEETIPFFKNSVRERFRLACPTTTRA